MKILKLEAENVKRLKAVSITPNGASVVIGGNNGNGKSSVLDSIAYALGGKDLMCDEPIRRGEKTARVRCDLGELIVIRTFTPTGGTLKVTTPEGAIMPSPQAVLDKLTGALTFDPLAFTRMNAKQQSETLRKLVGLDTSANDAERAKVYADRTEWNRATKILEGQCATAPSFADAPTTEISIADLVAKSKAYRDHNARVTRHGESVAVATDRRDRLRVELANAEAALVAASNALNVEIEKAPSIPDANGLVDVDGIDAMIADAQTVNAKVRANVTKSKLSADLEARRKRESEMTARIETLDQAKIDALKVAKFPIEGLSLGDTGPTFDGLPIDQSSQAQKIRISMAIGLAMNPKLRVVLIRDGSLLDESSLAVIAEMAAASDAQVWIERVGHGAECSVIIEDGAVSEEPKS